MTTVAEPVRTRKRTGSAPVQRSLPNGRMYYSPWGLFPFQEEHLIHTYFDTRRIAVWDTGLGKTHLAMALTALLFEEGAVDHVVICAEAKKVGEWKVDFETFTTVDARVAHGPSRKRVIEDLPQAYLSTYETIKSDAVRFVKRPGRRSTKSIEPGPLCEVFAGKRVLFVYDEMPKLKNRGSGNHKAHEALHKAIRKSGGDVKILGLTGTPMERDIEDLYNLGRLVRPDLMPTVADFESKFVLSRDPFGRPNFSEIQIRTFADLVAPMLLRKRKTDPDVIAQFPKVVEESSHIEMHEQHRTLYAAVESLFDPPEGEQDQRSAEQVEADERLLFGACRLVAGHPASLLHAQSVVAKAVVATLGEATLRSIPSTKTLALIEYLTPLVKGQRAKAVVFTFFGQAVLREVAKDLREAGFNVIEHHGGLSPSAAHEAQQAFKASQQPCVFLSSDAGAKGLNLPEATYVVNYEMPLTYANYTQRINRVSRISDRKDQPPVTAMSFILDGTVEQGLAQNVLKRNEHQDIVLGDEDAGDTFITAAQRRAMLGIYKGKKKAA